MHIAVLMSRHSVEARTIGEQIIVDDFKRRKNTICYSQSELSPTGLKRPRARPDLIDAARADVKFGFAGMKSPFLPLNIVNQARTAQ